MKTAVALLKNAGAVNLQKDILLNKHAGKKFAPDLAIFDEFTGDFDEKQLNKLSSIPSGQSRDSTFVLTVMRYLYPDPWVLSNKSVTGKTRNKVKKPKLTPRKETLIRVMLKKRICAEKGCSDSAILQRLDRVHKLMKDAIAKIKPKDPTEATISNNQNAVNQVQPLPESRDNAIFHPPNFAHQHNFGNMYTQPWMQYNQQFFQPQHNIQPPSAQTHIAQTYTAQPHTFHMNQYPFQNHYPYPYPYPYPNQY